MPFSVIDKGSKYFTANLHTGTGASRSITGLEFAPEMVWFKGRSVAYNNHIYDIIRGTTKAVMTNLTNAETTYSDALTAFNSDGYTIGANANVNESSATYVSWNWKANGAGVSNTAGTISSTVSANTTSGFSIVSYTSDGNSGATVGHGLGVAPKMVIVKRRNSAEDWGVGHTSLGWTNFLRLNTTGASSSSAGLWNNTAPSSTVVTLGNSGISNVGSGTTMIMYCFAEVKGYSKFGSYTGNSSADGTFVYTGFKPAFVMVKNTNYGSGTDWFMLDNKRNTYNVENLYLSPNLSAAEATGVETDFLSNGFKLRHSSIAMNNSSYTYIYMAFADNPFVSSKGIPCTAR